MKIAPQHEKNINSLYCKHHQRVITKTVATIALSADKAIQPALMEFLFDLN
jgi:hypothetical protein